MDALHVKTWTCFNVTLIAVVMDNHKQRPVKGSFKCEDPLCLVDMRYYAQFW